MVHLLHLNRTDVLRFEALSGVLDVMQVHEAIEGEVSDELGSRSGGGNQVGGGQRGRGA